MSETKSVNNEIISREASKEIKIPDILDEAKIQEVINIFCKDLSKINTLDECGWTPLYRTVVAGDLNASHILITKGANPNIQCSMGETPLYQAVDMCKLDHVKLLINTGANPNIVQDDGLSPLHSAVVRQNLLIVKFLLKNGSNPNIKSKIYDQTPVHLAIKNNVDPMILLLLVQFNGSLLEKDKFGKRPIDYICSKEMKDAIEKLKFEKNPNKKTILFPSFQTPKKYKNWAISKVYSNTIRSKSPRADLNINSKTVLKDPGNLKYNIIGTNGTDRYNNIINGKINGNPYNKKYFKKKSKSNEISAIDNEKEKEIELLIEKENYDPNLKKRKLSFSIKEESSVIDSDKGDNSFSERMNIKNSFFIKNKNKLYQSDIEDDKKDKIYRLSNMILSSKKIGKNKDNNEKGENQKNNNCSKIPKNRPYTKSVSERNHISYVIPNNNTYNGKNNNIIINKEPSNYKFVQIYGNSKAKKGSFSINTENQRRIQNQSLNMSDFKSMTEKSSTHSNNYLYTKPILSLNELNSKKLNLSNYNLNHRRVKTINRNNSINNNNYSIYYSSYSNKNNNNNNNNNTNNINSINNKNSNNNINNKNNTNNTNSKNSSNNINNTDKKSSTNKKNSSNNIKRLFTFMDNENGNNNTNTNKKSGENNTNILLYGNKTNINKSRNLNNEIFSENDNSNSNIDYQGKTYSISNPTTNRNNTSTYYDESSLSYNNYLWKFKTLEDDNIFHNKKMSGNTSLTACSYNIDITNQNALYPIYEWLKEINLSFYYNLFIEKKIYNLDKVIFNLKNGICNITKKDILKIGIYKPGHIYRIITKMEVDSEKINNQISNILLGKKSIPGAGEINVLKNSIVYCCGCCSVNNQSKYYCNNDLKKYQLEQWLSRIKMSRYQDNFIKNGFDMFEYFILQMFSSYPIDENILRDELNIININDRDFILLQINKDIKYIIQKTKKIINSSSSLNEIRFSKKNCSIKDFKDENNEQNKQKDDETTTCVIF